MNARRISMCAVLGLLSAALGSNIHLPANAASVARQTEQLRTNSTGKPFISEVAPAASLSKPAWIEIAVQSQGYQVFVPVTARDSAGAATAATTAMQSSPAAFGADLQRYVIDCEGFTYVFPDSLPPVPPNGIIVIELGTPGPDDLDFSDGVATLHASAVPTQVFTSTGGSVALYNGLTKNTATIVDFVAWGDVPATRDDHAVLAGLWHNNATLTYDPGFGGDGALKTPRKPGSSFGRYAGEWASYRAGYSSRGEHNPPPVPMNTFNPNGEVQDAATFAIGWSRAPGATGYEFELSATPDFNNPLVHIVTLHTGWRPSAPLVLGMYYWRLRTVGQNGAQSGYYGPFQNTITTPRDPIARVTLMTDSMYRIQRKDTTMLDIGGGQGNGYGSDQSGSPRDHTDTRDRWDGPHVNNDADKFPTFSWNGFDNTACVRASVAMMTAFYSGNLSVDRISYHIFETAAPGGEPDKGMPEGDLGFGEGASSVEPLEWALGGAQTESAVYCPDPPSDGEDEEYTCNTADPNATPSTITFTIIRSILDSGRPFIVGTQGHAQVADGYMIDADGYGWIRIFNPVPVGNDGCVPGQCSGIVWKYWETFKTKINSYVVVKQGETINPRSDEVFLKQDTDNDGINDYDEVFRFPTDADKKDTDGDGVNDKDDIAEYVFNASDKYSKRDADLSIYGISPNGGELYADLDTLRKEVDWDHDDDGIPDGCEDRDHDGHYGTTILEYESNNFNPQSKQPCVPILFIGSPTTDHPANVGSTLNPGIFLIGLGAYVPDVMTPKPTYTPDQFTVKVGSKTATVLTITKVGDFTHELRVQAPTQTTPGKYDLTVTFNFLGESTSRADAVQYESPPIGIP